MKWGMLKQTPPPPPVILLRNYDNPVPPDNAVWLYALPFIYLSCVDSVAAQRAHTILCGPAAPCW